MKQCGKCKKQKELNKFTKNKSKKDGYGSWCKSCYSVYKKSYYSDNKNTINQERRMSYQRDIRPFQNSHLQVKYNISIEEFEEMLLIQENKCAICNKEFSKTNPACVDHCHTTNNIRSLLCRKCNWAIGFLQDDPNLCRMAASYLEIHKILLTPEDICGNIN